MIDTLALPAFSRVRTNVDTILTLAGGGKRNGGHGGGDKRSSIHMKDQYYLNGYVTVQCVSHSNATQSAGLTDLGYSVEKYHQSELG